MRHINIQRGDVSYNDQSMCDQMVKPSAFDHEMIFNSGQHVVQGMSHHGQSSRDYVIQRSDFGQLDSGDKLSMIKLFIKQIYAISLYVK